MHTFKKLAHKTLRLITPVMMSFIFLTVFSVLFIRFFNPPFTSFMIWESNFFKKKLDHNWVSIGNMGENITLSVIATEDSNFCNHLGVDVKEIYRVIRRGERRGASTPLSE